jgi:cytoskeletal protein CcmA (bactofilin family)
MKTQLVYLAVFAPLFLWGQFKADETITIVENQDDDFYAAGEIINMESKINGDFVVAGSEIRVRDSLQQDLLVAGGDVFIMGPIGDDVRAMAGKLTISNDVADDVIVFGGEVFVTDNAKIHGNLVNFSGKITVEGDVDGMIKAYGGDLDFNGSVGQGLEVYGGDISIDGLIHGKSKIVADEVTIGDRAQFYGDVDYWTESGEIDFGNALIGSTANFNEDLMKEREEFSWKALGIASLGFWIFYVLSAFLVLLLLHLAFRKYFKRAADSLEGNFWKGFGYGLIYIIGFPLVIGLTFALIIGIPIGLFLLSFYLFSIFFGHLVAASIASHYWNLVNKGSMGFWGVLFLSLAIAMVLRLLTLVPFLGFLLSVVVLAIAYGGIMLLFVQKKGNGKAVVA